MVTCSQNLQNLLWNIFRYPEHTINYGKSFSFILIGFIDDLLSGTMLVIWFTIYGQIKSYHYNTIISSSYHHHIVIISSPYHHHIIIIWSSYHHHIILVHLLSGLMVTCFTWEFWGGAVLPEKMKLWREKVSREIIKEKYILRFILWFFIEAPSYLRIKHILDDSQGAILNFGMQPSLWG